MWKPNIVKSFDNICKGMGGVFKEHRFNHTMVWNEKMNRYESMTVCVICDQAIK